MSTQPLPNAPAPQPLHANPSVAQCLQRQNAAYKAEIARGEFHAYAVDAAAKAYRNAMPPLDGHDNIRDFIVCVAHGVLIGVIDHKDSSKLLYAAQVALSLLRVKFAPAANQNPPASTEISPIPGTLAAG